VVINQYSNTRWHKVGSAFVGLEVNSDRSAVRHPSFLPIVPSLIEIATN
jgi:hypothetical protein